MACPPSSTKAQLLLEFAAELAKYSVSKGTIRFPADKPLPATLVRKLVKAKAAKNARKG
jgi:uncharacterized protein YdhG (YjbR/CyaY superfamily)